MRVQSTEYTVKHGERHQDAGTLYSPSRSPGTVAHTSQTSHRSTPNCNDVLLPNDDR